MGTWSPRGCSGQPKATQQTDCRVRISLSPPDTALRRGLCGRVSSDHAQPPAAAFSLHSSFSPLPSPSPWFQFPLSSPPQLFFLKNKHTTSLSRVMGEVARRPGEFLLVFLAVLRSKPTAEGKVHSSKQPGVKTPLQVLPNILCKTKNSLAGRKKMDIKVDYPQLPASPSLWLISQPLAHRRLRENYSEQP